MIQVIYQDDFYIAVDKPPGILVHRSEVASGEKTFLLQLVRNRIGQRVYPVHRLDKPTSGILLLALNKEAASLLMAAFARSEIQKKYLAVVRGYIGEPGEIDYPLKPVRDRKIDPEMKDLQAKPAVTRFSTLANVELPFAVGKHATARYSLIEAIPETGRRHQIRRHFKHIFHPVIGDVRYGDGAHNRLFRSQFNVRKLLLWSREVNFFHPYHHQTVRISLKLDPESLGLFEKLGWADRINDLK